MTDAELVEYYINLLILQYKNLEKAPEHIKALAESSMIFELLEDVKNAYDIDTAVGVQLEVLGKYIGLEKTIFITNDTDYRFYLKFKIIKNNSNASLKEIDTLFFDFFGVSIFAQDNLDMTIRYVFVSPDVAQVNFLRDNNLLPKPAAVGIGALVGIDPVEPFVFNENSANGKGWGYLIPNAQNLEVDFGSGDVDLEVDFGSAVVNLEVVYDDTLVPAVAGGRWSYLI